MATRTVRIQTVVLFTSLGLHPIHIVNNIFLYNDPCSRTRMSLQQWFREMDCHIGQSQILLTSPLTWIASALLAVAQCAIDSSFKGNNHTCHLWSLNIYLFRVAEHSVRPTCPPSYFTTALCWSCVWSIARFENAWVVLLTVKCPFRNPAYM